MKGMPPLRRPNPPPSGSLPHAPERQRSHQPIGKKTMPVQTFPRSGGKRALFGMHRHILGKFFPMSFVPLSTKTGVPFCKNHIVRAIITSFILASILLSKQITGYAPKSSETRVPPGFGGEFHGDAGRYSHPLESATGERRPNIRRPSLPTGKTARKPGLC